MHAASTSRRSSIVVSTGNLPTPALTGSRAAVTAVRSKDVGSSQKAKENRFDREYISRIESRVFNSWQRRIEAARNFKFSKKESKNLVTSYSKNSLPFNEFCRKNCIDKDLFWNTVIDAIIYNWVDDECFDRIYEKELSNGNAEKVEHFFYQLTKRRKENKALK